jgi:hypothetical protein
VIGKEECLFEGEIVGEGDIWLPAFDEAIVPLLNDLEEH